MTKRKRNAEAPHRDPGSAASYWLYGTHAVTAALGNPERRVERLIASPEAARRLAVRGAAALARRGLEPEPAGRGALAALLPPGTVHQGVALRVRPLAQPDLAALLERLDATTGCGRQLLVALDQVSDPHNAGAVLRSAAAFGAAGVLVPHRRRAPEGALLAKAASGALDLVPYVDAGNLARAFEALKDRGFWLLGLAAEAEATLAEADAADRLVLVLGGEEKGLRRLTREACDRLARLPTRPPLDQLNVSSAAAIALYELLGRPDDVRPSDDVRP